MVRVIAYMERYGYEGGLDLLRRVATAERVVADDAAAQNSATKRIQ